MTIQELAYTIKSKVSFLNEFEINISKLGGRSMTFSKRHDNVIRSIGIGLDLDDSLYSNNYGYWMNFLDVENIIVPILIKNGIIGNVKAEERFTLNKYLLSSGKKGQKNVCNCSVLEKYNSGDLTLH